MGATLSKLIDRLFGWRRLKVLVLGLDAAGKTTILYKLKLNEIVETIPTIGFNVETVNFNKTSFTVWDLGRQRMIRALLHHYYENTDAIVFVVDACDR